MKDCKTTEGESVLAIARIFIIILPVFFAKFSFANTNTLSSEVAVISQQEQGSGANPLLDRLSAMIEKDYRQKLPSAQIELPNFQILGNDPALKSLSNIQSARILEDRADGKLVVETVGEKQDSTQTLRLVIHVPYRAWMNVYVANKRISQGTPLLKDDFKMDRINVASGMNRELRTTFLSQMDQLHRFEAKQTILEGTPLSAAILKKTPDLKRGEVVPVDLVSGDLVLSTMAQILESAAIGEKVKVLTQKTKRELEGVVRSDRKVEVRL